VVAGRRRGYALRRCITKHALSSTPTVVSLPCLIVAISRHCAVQILFLSPHQRLASVILTRASIVHCIVNVLISFLLYSHLTCTNIVALSSLQLIEVHKVEEESMQLLNANVVIVLLHGNANVLLWPTSIRVWLMRCCSTLKSPSFT